MIDTKIETFLTICKYMNFTRAAEELHLTQSAVSQQISLLEDYYNTKLFTYSNRTLSLTKAGIYLRNNMESLFNDSLKIKHVISNSLEYPPIRIGATLTIGNYYLPKIIVPFVKENKANYKIFLYDTQKILSLIDEGKIDIALVEGIYRKSDYESKVFFNDSIVFVCNTDMDTSQIKNIEDLFHIPLLLREKGSGTRELFENSLKENGYEIDNFTNILETNSIQLIKEFLYSNFGFSILYKSAINNDIETGKLKTIELKSLEINHPFTAIWKKNSSFGKEYSHLVSQLLNENM